MIAARYPPEFEGGSERVVRSLARGLRDLGHAVRIVAGTDRPADADARAPRPADVVDGIEVRRLPASPPELADPTLSRPRLEREVEAALGDVDIVHVHHWSTLSRGLVRALAPRRPVIATLHDHFATCPRFFRASPHAQRCPPRGDVTPCVACLSPDLPGWDVGDLARGLTERAREFEAEVTACALWIAPSEFHARRCRELMDLAPERGRVLAPGLTRTLRRRAHPRQPAPFLRLLHFGNLCDEKGTFDIVEAAALLPRGSVELVLAGRALSPGLEARVERIAKGARVRCAGPYSGRELEELAATADLGLFPTRAQESYGLVLDEAHALGLPAWTSDRGALAERRVPGELSLPAEDPAAWAEALAGVVADRSSLESLRARVEALQPLSTDACAREHARLYADVLAERAR